MADPRGSAAVVLSVLVLIAGCSSTTARSSATPQRVTGAAAPAAPDGQQPDAGGRAEPSAPTANGALYAAQTYVRLWARPTMNQRAWYATVRRWVTPAYAQLLADTDPSNVPAHGVTGPPRPVTSTAAVVVADVPTDAGPIRVTVINTGGRWLVSSAGPAAVP
ncbi:hypothetical protein [Actinoplanes sp. NPDC051411]|uniref:hypothetical protein n=1 Tax=Actinoplanes sp. NPDC051411 TaxID=3155522 RepID=UPI003444A153